MRLSEFLLLDKDDQMAILWDSGVFLCEKYENECSYFVYNLYTFQVMVEFDNAGRESGLYLPLG
ncbi:hypothetical protein ACT6NV_07565 [Robiginitalea sp. IMCC44478]|uniref:hypothetical protein n=1 Tax=Robiginitalea sp. IMCC44478 TaxID=3459122 RepID=UPI0040431DDE